MVTVLLRGGCHTAALLYRRLKLSDCHRQPLRCDGLAALSDAACR